MPHRTRPDRAPVVDFRCAPTQPPQRTRKNEAGARLVGFLLVLLMLAMIGALFFHINL